MRYLIYFINTFKKTKQKNSPYAFGTETFSKQTRARGITKGVTISQTKLDNYIRYVISYNL